MEAQGSRTIIHMPSGARYYLLSFPYAGEDNFIVKMPYENRVECESERRALDDITDVINEQVVGIHEHYTEAIEGWKEEAEGLLKAVDNGGVEAVEIFGGEVLRRMVESMRSF